MQFILNPFNRNVSDEDLIIDIADTAKKLGKNTITMSDYQNAGKYAPCTVVRRFGSWFKALSKAGLEPSRSLINISNEDLFENIENLWRCFGRQPKYHEVVKPLSKYSVGTYEKRFGTYYNALKSFIEYVNGEISEHPNKNRNITENPRKINYRLRFKVMQRDGFKCRICGRSPASDPSVILHIDHIIPCAKGGKATIDNLQTLCSVCNLGKSDLDMKK